MKKLTAFDFEIYSMEVKKDHNFLKASAILMFSLLALFTLYNLGGIIAGFINLYY